MKALIITICLSALSSNIFAQISFEKIYGEMYESEYGLSIQQVPDKSYIISAYVETCALCLDFLLLKIDAYGDTVWVKVYTGAPTDAGYSLKNLPENIGFIITGCRYCAFTTRKIYLVKTDTLGDIIWAKQYAPNVDQAAYDIELTDVDNYVITGYASVQSGSPYVYLFKTDQDGTLLWSRYFGGGYDIGYSLCRTNDGGFAIAGRTDSFGYGSADVYVIKVNDSGAPQWTKTYGGAAYDEGRSIEQTSDGGYIIAGYTSSFGHGNADVYLVRTDENGDTLWTRTYGGTALDKGYSAIQRDDGGFLITGVTSSFGNGGYDVYLIRTKENGDTMWTKTFGGSDYDQGFSTIRTIDGGYIIVGVSSTLDYYYDIYVIKLNELGITTWIKEIPIDQGLHSEIYPNPFNSSTTIRYNLSEPDQVLLEVFDVTAKMVAVLVDDYQNDGDHLVPFSGESLPPGMYFYKLTAGQKSQCGKIILNK
jgi:hypothetical protein